jgi:hypothetical protein
MIALDDAALARIIHAAEAVPHGERRRWLQELADDLDPPADAARRAIKRARWRRWYHNDRAGVAVTRVHYSGVGLANLIVGGWLRAHDEA